MKQSEHKEKQCEANEEKSLLFVTCICVTQLLLYEMQNPLILPKKRGGEGKATL